MKLVKIVKLGFFTLFFANRAPAEEALSLAKRLDKILKADKILTIKFADQDGLLIEDIKENQNLKIFNNLVLKKIQSKYIIEKAPESLTLRIHDEDQEIDFSHINDRVIVVDLFSFNSAQPGNSAGGGGIGN